MGQRYGSWWRSFHELRLQKLLSMVAESSRCLRCRPRPGGGRGEIIGEMHIVVEVSWPLDVYMFTPESRESDLQNMLNGHSFFCCLPQKQTKGRSYATILNGGESKGIPILGIILICHSFFFLCLKRSDSSRFPSRRAKIRFKTSFRIPKAPGTSHWRWVFFSYVTVPLKLELPGVGLLPVASCWRVGKTPVVYDTPEKRRNGWNPPTKAMGFYMGKKALLFFKKRVRSDSRHFIFWGQKTALSKKHSNWSVRVRCCLSTWPSWVISWRIIPGLVSG